MDVHGAGDLVAQPGLDLIAAEALDGVGLHETVLLDGNAVLLIGFNEMNTVIMNPQTGTIYKMGMNDSKTWFKENGNRFITYIRNEN